MFIAFAQVDLVLVGVTCNIHSKEGASWWIPNAKGRSRKFKVNPGAFASGSTRCEFPCVSTDKLAQAILRGANQVVFVRHAVARCVDVGETSASSVLGLAPGPEDITRCSNNTSAILKLASTQCRWICHRCWFCWNGWVVDYDELVSVVECLLNGIMCRLHVGQKFRMSGQKAVDCQSSGQRRSSRTVQELNYWCDQLGHGGCA
jgi:hypothetical protein